MRIAVMGAGAVGGYFGALLAKAGHEVAFIARGAHLEALKKDGLAVEGPRGDWKVKTIATDNPAELEPVDVVLFCVKTYDTEDAGGAIKPLLARGGCCISLQNGVDSLERLTLVLGKGSVLPGLAFVSGVIDRPGVIRYVSAMSSLHYGEPDGAMSERAIAFRDICKAAGIGAVVEKDIRAAQWNKFVALATNASLTSLIRAPAGVIYHDPMLIGMARDAFSEVAAVGRAHGVDLPEDVVEKSMNVHKGFPKHMYASMYHDIARGRRMELESLGGYVVRLGKQLGVPTPVHSFAYACLRPFANGTPEILREAAGAK